MSAAGKLPAKKVKTTAECTASHTLPGSLEGRKQNDSVVIMCASQAGRGLPKVRAADLVGMCLEKTEAATASQVLTSCLRSDHFNPYQFRLDPSCILDHKGRRGT